MEYEKANSYYDFAYKFSNLILVKQKGKYGWIDKTGEIIIPIKYKYAADWSGYAYKTKNILRVKANGKKLYINNLGECIKDCE